MMIQRTLLGAAFAIALSLGALAAALGQSASSQLPAIETWAHDFTVLTMAPDGAWGAATDSQMHVAIHQALIDCTAMSGKELGCGAELTTVRGGWSLGIRCGDENIIVADRQLAEAERRASRRERELREYYLRAMAPCARVVTVDPNGTVAQTPGYAGGLRSKR